MKDQLAGSPPTIGSSRRQGMTRFDVHCAAPCGHTASVTFAVLNLPDDTVFLDIPKLKRLRCGKCGRVARRISPDWTEVVAFGNGKRPVNCWILVTKEPSGTEGRSSAQWSETAALNLARRLMENGLEVLRIEGPSGDMLAPDIHTAIEQLVRGRL